jgi:hypothetical protein
MSYERNTAVILFAVAVIIAILAAFVTTLERVDTRRLTTRPRPVRRASLSHARHWTAHQASRC